MRTHEFRVEFIQEETGEWWRLDKIFDSILDAKMYAANHWKIWRIIQVDIIEAIVGQNAPKGIRCVWSN